MKRLMLPLVLCLLAGCATVSPLQHCMQLRAKVVPRTVMAAATAPSIALSWTAPTTFTDNNPIPATDAVTYNLYGAMQGQSLTLLQSGIATTSNVRTNVTAGTHCYAVTAVVAAIESPQSAEACATIAETPATPTNLTATPQ